MTYRVITDGTCAVDPNYKYRKIDKDTPTGVKILLISKRARVLTQGHHMHGNAYFTHWAPFPTFDKNEHPSIHGDASPAG